METHLLSDVEQEVYLQPAATGKRFANALVDVIGFYVFVFFVGILLGLNELGLQQDIYSNQGNVFEYLLSYLCYLTYYTVFEGLTKGRTLGKYFTGTVAIKTDGSAITWKDAALRSLSRLVPFEAFSAFGYAPWHDAWTQTTVVKK